MVKRSLRISLEEVQRRVSEKHPEIEVLELVGVKYIRCLCHKCEQIYIANKYNAINSHSGCPVCRNTYVIAGFNDIATTSPEMVKYFTDSDYPKMHSISSNKKTTVRCPDCGYIKITSPNAMTRNFACPSCSDGISYPNKFVREVLNQLHLDAVYEYQPHWAKPYFFDNWFQHEGFEYIVEVDGGYHYERTKKDALFQKKYKNTTRNDQIKETLASQHNIKVIRIDAFQSEPDYLKASVMKSELAELFDLSSIDWCMCDKKALASKMIESCKLLNENYSVDDISKKLQVGTCSVRNYLKRGRKLGLCNYGDESYIPADSSRKVYVFDHDLNFILVARDQERCASDLTQKLGGYYISRGIYESIKTEKPYKGLYFLSNKKITRTLEINKSSFQKELERRINVYTS